jgi:hypothetical protein
LTAIGFAYSKSLVVDSISPTIARLRTFGRNPEPRTKGNKNAKLTKAFADKFCAIIAESDDSVFKIIEQNPDFPSFNVLYHWQQRVPWFHDMWKHARIRQTLFLAHKCLELAKSTEPKTAHVARVKFDIYRWFCAKFNPEIFADKPAQAPNVQTVNVGVSINPERLTELRTKLDSTRSAFVPQITDKTKRLEPGKLSPV